MSVYFFLHVFSDRAFPTDTPHQWLLDHRDDNLLAAARERLVLSSDDPARCLRVATRRCNLVLIQIVNESQIVVEHWSDPPLDLRVWAKEHGFNRSSVRVVFKNLKNNKIVVHEDAEDVLHFGVRVGDTFPLDEYAAKYGCRHAEEADDHDTASAVFTNFVWPGVIAGKITWRVLKSIWKAEQIECPNCDMPLVLVGFEWRRGMLSFRSGRTVRMCPRCRRRFESHEPEPLAWVAAVLPPALRPTHLEQWRRFEINWEWLTFKHERPVQFADREG